MDELNLQKLAFATTLKELNLSSNNLIAFKEYVLSIVGKRKQTPGASQLEPFFNIMIRMGTLPNLEVLDLSHNKLRRFAMESGKHLSILDLSHNMLSRVRGFKAYFNESSYVCNRFLST